MKIVPVRVVDLFAGAGGLSAGLKQASSSFETVCAVEFDLAAAASFEATFGKGIVYAGPIDTWLANEALPDQIDLVVGGPPCQGFSTLGKQDAEDERNNLWHSYAETIRRLQPKYFVVENVAAFAKSPQFDEFNAVISEGFLNNYVVDFKVLNAADFGSPQARRRAVMIGSRKDLPQARIPSPSHLGRHRTVADALKGVRIDTLSPDLPSAPTVRVQGKDLPGPFAARDLHLGRNYTELSLARFAAIPAGGNRFDLPEELLAPCWVKHKSGSGDVMGRLRWDRPSVTIRTEFFKPEKGRYLHPTANRAITHLEAALLQGFPETHRFVGSKTSIARQIGNAVPIALGNAIGGVIVEALSAATLVGPALTTN